MLNPENKFRGRAGMGAIKRVKKIDDHTVRFDLKHPWLPFKKVISSTRTLISLVPSTQAVEAGSQDRSPVGTGPFKMEEWQPAHSFTVAKNLEYWQPGKPYLEKIIFRAMPDTQTRYASLKAGQIDVIWMDRGNILSKAGKDQDFRVFTGEDNGAEIFILNTSKPPLDDIRVRRAIAHAGNQNLQVKMAYQGSIPVVHHPFGNQCECPDTGYREYDPDKARKLLAGYQPIEIEILHSNSKRGHDIGVVTQQLLKDVGVKSTPVALDFGSVIKKVLSGDYQVSTWRISSRPDQGPALFRMFHSKSRANFSRYQNPKMDELLVAQRMTVDPEKRREILCGIAELINDEVPIIYRGGMRGHVIANKKVQGVSKMINSIMRFEGVWIGP
jgi:4-phytase/acid phosphatase/peptide/nickel transport system substrate-binding protein